MNYVKHILVTVLLCLLATTTIADTKNHEGLEKLSNQIKTITYSLDRGNFDQEDLAKWTKGAI